MLSPSRVEDAPEAELVIASGEQVTSHSGLLDVCSKGNKDSNLPGAQGDAGR